MPTKVMNFQSIMLTLEHFWAEHGCLIWQPYYSQVGAGTYNPATILRVLGPEPWRVAYIEPSVRPDDGRYGENPNRLQMHYQFQVVLKPDPGNPQELYLQSLAALGIDPRQHDIRFVEDNWESPALGAWGLGWEVWLDGQEITQYTYFQQAGSQVLDPVSVEITYGLDRIAIALQQVDNFRKVQWSPTFSYGDVNLQGEFEHTKYYFEVADIERMRQLYDLFEAEANACLSQGLILPALDYILKCSHTFNVLDARGAVGVTERQSMFGRMRDLSRRTSEAYLAERQRLEFPWLNQATDQAASPPEKIETSAPVEPGEPVVQALAPFLLEIGTEELPVGDLEAALEQIRERLPILLQEAHLAHGEVVVSGTPRRLVVFVSDVASRQPDLETIVKGPPANRAYGPGGEPTAAAEGFARSKGVSVHDLQLREMDGGRYVVAIVRQAGRPARTVLAEIAARLVSGLRFDKPMRWNSSNVFFSRPVRWLLALYGEQIVPFEFAGLHSGRTTRGLRFRHPEEIIVQYPQDYFTALENQGILLDTEKRQETIRSQINALAAEIGGSTPLDAGLLREVTNLVEAPVAFRGSFEAAHLELPREVLISVMKKHQRYFPVVSPADGNALLPYFIAVSNGSLERGLPTDGLDLVIEGNEHVIRARFSDAAFFVHEDLKHALESYLPRLGTLTFQTRLGSMLDKSQRLVALVDDLAPLLGLNADEIALARRAAMLSKADLVTHMVIEMTSLQGIMGSYYALQSGESPLVAQAVLEHYLPRSAGDRSPAGSLGLLIGLADRLDSLVGLFAAGLAPSGSKDPFGQRRAAQGLAQNLLSWDLSLDLRPLLQAAASHLPIPAGPEILASVGEFITERLRNTLLDAGARYDLVEAVLALQGHNPARAGRAVHDLTDWVARTDWSTILPAYARCVRIVRPYQDVFTVQPEALVEPAEIALWEALQQAEKTSRQEGAVNDFLAAFLPLIPAVSRFFEAVLVMAEDDRLRQNRLGLLQRIAALRHGSADLAKLEGF